MSEQKKVSFYFDAQKTNPWTWESYLTGDVGMSGTDSQILSLVIELSPFYEIIFYSNVRTQPNKNFSTFFVENLQDAASMGAGSHVDLFIFANKADEFTIQGINKLNELKLPFVMWDHNGPGGNMENLLFESAFLKRIVCVSKSQADNQRHRKYFSKITYIHLGRDYDQPLKNTLNDKDLVLGYLGALTENKGFHWVAKAWPKIKSSFPNAILYVIGSIKTHDITKKTGDLGIAEPEFEDIHIKPYLGNSFSEIKNNGVIFTGHISPNEIKKIFPSLTLGIVNPNTNEYSETFCLSAIDFEGNEVPVIGAYAGGLKETVSEGKTGILIRNSNDLGNEIIKLLKNKKRLAYFRSNCYQWVKTNFSRENTVVNWRNLIEDVLNKKSNKMLSLKDDLSIKSICKEILRKLKITFK